jgi:hypothetical protein
MPIQYGQVGNIPNASIADGLNAAMLQGKAGELVAAELHGKYYTANYRGLLFYCTTATAGTTIPIQAGSLASTFTFINPLGSGKNMELVSYSAAFEAATMVVSDVSLYYQQIIGLQTAPTVVTAITATRGSGILGTPGQGNSVVQAYSAATLVGAITKGPTLFGPTTTQSVAGGSTGPGLFRYDFDGAVIVPPGTVITTAGTAAQTSAASQILYWIEWPL